MAGADLRACSPVGLQTSSLCVNPAWSIFLCPTGDCPRWGMTQRLLALGSESIQLFCSPDHLMTPPELDHGGIVCKAAMN